MYSLPEPIDSPRGTPLPTTPNEPAKTFDMSVKEAAKALGKYDKYIVRLIKKGGLPYQEITNERNLKEYRLNRHDINQLKGQLVGQDQSPISAGDQATGSESGQTKLESSPTKMEHQSDKSDASLVKYLKDRVTELEKHQSDNVEHKPLVDRLIREIEDLRDRLKSKEDTTGEYSEDLRNMAGQVGYFKGQADALGQEVLLLREGKHTQEGDESEMTVDQDDKETVSRTEVRQSPTNFLGRIFGTNPNRN